MTLPSGYTLRQADPGIRESSSTDCSSRWRSKVASYPYM